MSYLRCAAGRPAYRHVSCLRTADTSISLRIRVLSHVSRIRAENNNDLGLAVSVNYITVTGEYDFSSIEHFYNGDPGGMLAGTFRDYQYGQYDKMSYQEAQLTTREEFDDNTRLLVNLSVV